MRNCLGLHYTTLLINFHLQKHGDKEVSMSTVNLAFGRIQPKITKNHKIRHGTKNEGKWKETTCQQVKQWLIMINIIPEEKEHVKN